MTFQEILTLKQSSTLNNQLKVSLAFKGREILTEGDGVANHANRATCVAAAMSSSGAIIDRLAWACVTAAFGSNGELVEGASLVEIGGQQALPDAYVLNVVTAAFNDTGIVAGLLRMSGLPVAT